MRRTSISWGLSALITLAAVGTGIAVTRQEPTPQEAAYLNEQPRLDRLALIAGQLYDPNANTEELIYEAARLCGFSIWTESREKVAEPLGQPRLGYAITQQDIKWFSQMQKAGHSVTFGNLVNALDYLYKELGGDGSVGPKLNKTLTGSFLHKNASVRAWGSFLQAANAQNPNQSKAAFATAESVLSPVEVLFLLRVVTEDMTRGLRVFLKSKEKDLLYASIEPTYQIGPLGTLPGWAEDLGSGVISEGWNQLTSNVDIGISAAAIERYRQLAGRINVALSLLKLIQTYASLESKFWTEDGGPVLIRTTDTSPGDKMTVASQWYFDMPKLSDFLKENRWVIQLFGIDPDAPHSGPLEGVETDWQFVRGSNMPPNQIVQVHVDMSKVVTDHNGVARVEFEGTPQRQAMNPNQVAPVDKVLQLQVTPQTKATSIGQDIVDALTGALGVTSGGLGLVTPLIESLYRLKWVGTKGYKMKVRDWVPGETRGTVTITVHGYGSWSRPGERHWENIDRWIEYRNVVMQDLGLPIPDPPHLDPSTPALVRQQAQETYIQMLEASKQRTYIAEGPGSRFLQIHDSSGFDYLSSECSDPRPILNSYSTTGRESETFTAGDVLAGNIPQIGIGVSLDLIAKKAVVQIDDKLQATARGSSTLTGAVITSERNLTVHLLQEVFSGSQGTEVDVTETQDVKTKQLAYKGHRDIPFSFGPENRCRGMCTIDFELIRVPKKNP